MNPFPPGFRELARSFGRLVGRVRLWRSRRQLAHCEVALGLLGWQQADYEGEMQDHVKRLLDCEREQGRLTNESAALGLEICRIEEQRVELRREFEDASAEALARELPGATDPTELEERVSKLRVERKELAARLPVMDRELASMEEQYRRLVLETAASPEAQVEMMRLSKIILALPRERAEWQAKLEEVARQAEALESFIRGMREARERFEARDGELRSEAAERQRSKRKLEKQIDSMEKAKTDPYREIGRALADHGIAPLNQPASLEAVQMRRREVASLEAVVAASLEESAQENRSAILQCWLIIGSAGVLVVAVILAIAFH